MERSAPADARKEQAVGIFDKIKDAADSHESQVEAGVDKLGDRVDERTGNKYATFVDKGQGLLKDRIGEPPADQAPEA